MEVGTYRQTVRIPVALVLEVLSLQEVVRGFLAVVMSRKKAFFSKNLKIQLIVNFYVAVVQWLGYPTCDHEVVGTMDDCNYHCITDANLLLQAF